MRVAVVGSGVAGLVCAHGLARDHDVVLFEAADRLGGHVRTVAVGTPAGEVHVDTGFIVFNEPNYPGLTRLLAELGVPTQPSDMSFSVTCDATDLEYAGRGPAAVFASRSSVLSASHLAMLRDVPRFNRAARGLVAVDDVRTSLADFVDDQRLSRPFVEHYLVPLGASIWSADPTSFDDIPAAALARFFDRHGMLALAGRPRWRTVSGGARRYVDVLAGRLAGRVRTGARVLGLSRDEDHVTLRLQGGGTEEADHVVLACHADEALAVLGPAATRLEREVLGSFRFQRNDLTLHTDVAVMPRRRRAWASWNFRHVTDAQHRHQPRLASVTYHANRLQSLATELPLFTTLNRDHAIDPAHVLDRAVVSHPVMDTTAMLAQRRHHELLAHERVSCCGAYWGYGFHEDGVQSAHRVLERLRRGT